MKYPYSMSSAVGYSIVLLVSLWWLPVLGPMIIGYITGRKAGGPVKGAIAMVVPIVLYFFIVYFMAIGWIHMPHMVSRYFTGYFASSVAGTSILTYVQETMNTGIMIGKHVENYLYYAPTAFFIMLAFAFIGGAISKQIIMERGIYPTRARPVIVKKEAPEVPAKKSVSVPKKAAPKKAPANVQKKQKKTKVEKKKKAPTPVDRDGKFVVHQMDSKKKVPVKKKYGITFL
ncbi:MAG: hypothetical protein GXO25_03255 [Euryarchaeota archaeon]|nr:hypothetical protein [Euryarchaeota archaeon]